jgi:hypothetical protein
VLLHGLLASDGKRAFALSLFSLFLAPTANSQEAARIPFASGAAPPRLFGGATGTAMLSPTDRPPPGGVGPGPLARDVEAEPGTRRTLAYSFRQSQSDRLVPVREPLEILQIEPAYRLRPLSIRILVRLRFGS